MNGLANTSNHEGQIKKAPKKNSEKKVESITTEEAEIKPGELWTFNKTVYSDRSIIVEVELNGKLSDIVEYLPDRDIFLVNGVETNVIIEKENTDLSINAVPTGGTYMGKWHYSINLLTTSAGAAASILAMAAGNNPIGWATGVVAFFYGTQTTLYYTVEQWRYAYKCQAYPYFNKTTVWTNVNRNVIQSINESGKFFSTQPVPASCTP
ncbi:hypothetical protein [Robertmurraya sp.]|uniref:hypothetical protein n=1 Tax=Robertmurraya sp. TaxID=2837525 RepID=UPI0037044B31